MTLQGGGDSILAKWNYSGAQIELEDETDSLLENGGLPLTHCLLGNFSCFLWSADFFQN